MNFRQVIKVIYSNHVLNSVRKNINPFKFRRNVSLIVWERMNHSMLMGLYDMYY